MKFENLQFHSLNGCSCTSSALCWQTSETPRYEKLCFKNDLQVLQLFFFSLLAEGARSLIHSSCTIKAGHYKISNGECGCRSFWMKFTQQTSVSSPSGPPAAEERTAAVVELDSQSSARAAPATPTIPNHLVGPRTCP